MSADETPGESSSPSIKGETDGLAERSMDQRWMRQALQLAEGTIGLASPNPRVGCVLVRRGVAVGRGAHRYDERDHAEIVALRDAGPLARGATAYVTLEPCSHLGRTGPCAVALREAGVARVVVATGDPNPQVNGEGLRMLREAGIAVTIGVMAQQARVLNHGFARFIRRGLPFVTVKAGVSLDGRIAPAHGSKPAGSVRYLTGARSLLAVQKLRHASDAVLTGIGTVLEDDPLLTDRSGGARRRRLLRVILDTELRLPLRSALVQSAQNDVLVCTLNDSPDGSPSASMSPAKRERWQALEQAGVQVCAVGSGSGGRVSLPHVMRLLAESYSVLNVLAEGGSQLNRSLLQGADGEPIADKLCLFYAPMFLGDEGVPLLGGSDPLSLELQRATVAESGSDFYMEASLRDPWRDS